MRRGTGSTTNGSAPKLTAALLERARDRAAQRVEVGAGERLQRRGVARPRLRRTRRGPRRSRAWPRRAVGFVAACPLASAPPKERYLPVVRCIAARVWPERPWPAPAPPRAPPRAGRRRAADQQAQRAIVGALRGALAQRARVHRAKHRVRGRDRRRPPRPSSRSACRTRCRRAAGRHRPPSRDHLRWSTPCRQRTSRPQAGAARARSAGEGFKPTPSPRGVSDLPPLAA